MNLQRIDQLMNEILRCEYDERYVMHLEFFAGYNWLFVPGNTMAAPMEPMDPIQ